MATLTVPSLMVLLTGCTSPPVGSPLPVADLVPQRCAPAPVPPEYRLPPSGALPDAVRRTVELARDEWQGWGGQIVDYREIDWRRTQAIRQLVQAGYPVNADAVTQGLLVPLVVAVGCWENDPRVYARLRAYWRPLQGRPDDDPNEPASRRRYPGDLVDSSIAVTFGRPASWSEAWSAAFLSYVVSISVERSPEAGTFTYSVNHTGYAAASVDAVQATGPGHRYVARSASAFAPRPGDMVCSYRNQPRREPWDPDQAGWRLGSAHCDLAIAVDQRSAAGRIFAVGGNVFQAVAVSVHATDTQGRLVDGPFRNWAIVLADRANPAGL